MAIYEIPTDNQDPAFNFFTDLNGTSYGFRFKYNTRLELWIVDLLDQNTDTIVYTLPYYSNRLLTKYVSLPGLPEGKLAALNNVEYDTDADRFNFSLNVKLYYNDLKDD